jgi:uncharacterized protein (DUF885 family)
MLRPMRTGRLLVAGSLVSFSIMVGCGGKAAPPSEGAAGPAPAAPASPSFEEAVDQIFAAAFAANPVIATQVGVHEHDARWPDLSAAGLEADRKRVQEALALLAQVSAGKLSADQEIDAAILRADLEQQVFSDEVEKPFRRDPLAYTSLIGGGLEDLVTRDFAPLADRTENVASRIEALPALCKQAIENLAAGETLAPQAKVALQRLDGLVSLLEEEIPKRIASAPQAAQVKAATPAAVAAVRELQAHVRDKLIPAAGDGWRLGADAFARKLELTLQSNIPAGELLKLAQAEHERVRGLMVTLGGELAPVLFTPAELRKIRRAKDPDTAMVRAVLDTLAQVHSSPEALRDDVQAKLDTLTREVKEKKILSLDPAEVLEVIWTPPHKRGVAVAGLESPGPLEAQPKGLASFYLVQPVPKEWPVERRESMLREYNDFMLEILSIHEAIPGHFVQLYHSKRNRSKVRRVLPNGPMVEGWAVYTEKVMVDAGFTGTLPGKPPARLSAKVARVMREPELRRKAVALHGMKFYLRAVANAILDNSIHAGSMNEDEAVALMVEKSYQEEGEARLKWVRAQVTSTQLSTYFAGAQAWFRLREQAEKRARDAGQPFDMAAFHDAALSHGAPPVHTLPRLLGWSE